MYCALGWKLSGFTSCAARVRNYHRRDFHHGCHYEHRRRHYELGRKLHVDMSGSGLGRAALLPLCPTVWVLHLSVLNSAGVGPTDAESQLV